MPIIGVDALLRLIDLVAKLRSRLPASQVEGEAGCLSTAPNPPEPGVDPATGATTRRGGVPAGRADHPGDDQERGRSR